MENINEFVFKGQLSSEMRLGQPLDAFKLHLELEQSTTQEGDIPSLWTAHLGGHLIEVTVLDEIVIGLSFNLSYHPEIPVFIDFEDLRCKLNCDNFSLVLNQLNQAKVPWSIDEQATGGTSIAIKLESGTLIQFTFTAVGNEVSHLGAFDWTLYNKLSEALKV